MVFTSREDTQCEYTTVPDKLDNGSFYFCVLEKNHTGEHIDGYNRKHKEWIRQHKCPTCNSLHIIG